LKYIILALLVLLLASAGVNYWQNGKIEQLNRDVATERANVQTAKDAHATQLKENADLREKWGRENEKNKFLAKEKNEAAKQFSEATAKLNSYRSRLENAASKKPALVGRLATRATQRVFGAWGRISDPECRNVIKGCPGPGATPPASSNPPKENNMDGPDTGND